VYPSPGTYFKQTLAEFGFRTEPGGSRGVVIYTFHLMEINADVLKRRRSEARGERNQKEEWGSYISFDV
jgi:hypothetical protein